MSMFIKTKVSCIFLCLLLVFTGISANNITAIASSTDVGYVVVYPQEPAAQSSPNYTVYVNDIQVPVTAVGEDKDVSYAHFAFAGKIKVRIVFSQNINTYKLSPVSYNLNEVKTGNTITFDLDKPRKLLLYDVNTINEHLCIFADHLEENPPKIGDSNVVNIMSTGVDNTGATNEITKIQNAINNLSNGQILYFPAGRYTAGGILYMKSNTSIYLAPGATIQASLTRTSGELQFNFNGVSNVKLFGRGSIDGRGDFHRPTYGGSEGGKTLIRVDSSSSSSNVTIEDIITKEPICWTSIVFNTNNWKVYNLKVVTGRKYPNRDGWDPHNATNMLIDNVFIYANDDPIAYSTTVDNLNLNTTIRNSVFSNHSNGTSIRIGPWIGSNTQNITIENNDHIFGGNSNYLFAIYSSGSLSNIQYKNNRVEKAQRGLFGVYTNWDDYYAGPQNGSLDGVIFDRLYVNSITNPGWQGYKNFMEAKYPDNFIKNIQFKDFWQEGNYVTNSISADLLIDGDYATNDNYVSFQDRSQQDSSLTGTYKGVNWGSSNWRTYNRSGDIKAYFNSSSTNEVTTSISIPSGTVLKGFKASDYSNGNATITVSSSGNETRVFNVSGSQGTDFYTGWSNAAQTITIKIHDSVHGCLDVDFDNFIFGAPGNRVNFEDRPTSDSPLTENYGGINWGNSSWRTYQHSNNKKAYFNNTSKNEVTTSITIPNGNVLTGLKLVSYSGANARVILSCQGNPTKTFEFNNTTPVLFTTGWTKPSEMVTIKITETVNGCSYVDFDDIVYQNTAVSFTGSNTPVIDINATSPIASYNDSLNGQFTITRSGSGISTASSLNVSYTIRGTALNGTDYQTIQNNVTIPAGQTSATINITPLTSGSYKTVFITLNSNSSYSLGKNYHAVVTLKEGDTKVDFEEYTTNGQSITGTYKGINWGTATPTWRSWGSYGGLSTRTAYIGSSSTSPVAKTISLPEGKVLKSMKIGSGPNSSGTVTIKSLNNTAPIITYSLVPNTGNTILTNWTALTGSVEITVTNSQGAESVVFDDFIYGDNLNLLKNVGFENNIVDWQAYNPSNCSISSVTTPIRTGTKSVLISNRNNSYTGINQSIKDELLQKGQGLYNISAYFRTASGNQNLKAVIRISDSTGVRYINASTTNANSSSWSNSFINNANITWSGQLIEAEFYTESTSGIGNYYVDDVSMIKVP